MSAPRTSPHPAGLRRTGSGRGTGPAVVARRSSTRAPRAGRAVTTALLLAAAASLMTGWAGPAAAQDGEGDGREARVRDIEYRVRDLVYRSQVPDNSERVEQAPEETTVTFAADVLFEYDRADLTPAARTRLEELGRQLSDLGPRTVTIGGHTDDHGDPAYNQDLSVRRAEAVRDALRAQLGDEFDLEVAGYGETQPVAPNAHEDGSDDPEGRALNRRVEVSYPTG
jgi:OOP family OmpA-OmpF porin